MSAKITIIGRLVYGTILAHFLERTQRYMIFRIVRAWLSVAILLLRRQPC